MDYRHMMIEDLRKALDQNETTSEELFEEAKTLAKQYQEPYNAFVKI